MATKIDLELRIPSLGNRTMAEILESGKEVIEQYEEKFTAEERAQHDVEWVHANWNEHAAGCTKVQMANYYNWLLDGKEEFIVDANGDDQFFRPIKAFASKGAGIVRISNLLTCRALNSDSDDEATGPVAKTGKAPGAVSICKSIFEKQHELGRAACLAECETAGINKSTAATQWQRFRKENGMAETEEKTPGKCAQIRTFCAENSTLERKEMCKQLIDLGFAKGTVQVQVGKWIKEQPAK